MEEYLKTEVKQHETKILKDKKTVSLQCSLLKNVPKIKLFTKKPQNNDHEKGLKL
jgi:hypothetical protein